MNKYLFSLAFILQGLFTEAQDQDIVMIHADDNLASYFTFCFPSFADATILFKNGTTSTARMNFNTLLCKMQFIDSKGDTLVLAKPEDIDTIRLNGHSFFFNRYFFEIIAASDPIKLVAMRKVNIDVIVPGALGTRSHTNSVETYDSYMNPAGPRKLVVNTDLSVQKETNYSLIGKNGETVKASKSGFLKTFPNDKNSIETFVKSNKINFDHQADLEKLFLFCNQQKG